MSKDEKLIYTESGLRYCNYLSTKGSKDTNELDTL